MEAGNRDVHPACLSPCSEKGRRIGNLAITPLLPCSPFLTLLTTLMNIYLLTVILYSLFLLCLLSYHTYWQHQLLSRVLSIVTKSRLSVCGCLLMSERKLHS